HADIHRVAPGGLLIHRALDRDGVLAARAHDTDLGAFSAGRGGGLVHDRDVAGFRDRLDLRRLAGAGGCDANADAVVVVGQGADLGAVPLDVLVVLGPAFAEAFAAEQGAVVLQVAAHAGDARLLQLRRPGLEQG